MPGRRGACFQQGWNWQVPKMVSSNLTNPMTLPGSGGQSGLSVEAARVIDGQMEEDDEMTGEELRKLLCKSGINVSSATALRWQTALGWTWKGTSYFQMIRDVNKEKQLQWTRENIDMSFRDVIFTDETTVQIETHRRTCCYRRGRKPKCKSKLKHPVKVHVWAGISHQGQTTLCIFEGKMNAALFISILERSLVPFIKAVYPDGHRFIQDNNPKHCSNLARQYYAACGINWWPTLPELPDLNPIELVWHELKEYIRREVKPRTKQDLITGIKAFWKTVSPAKC